MCGLICFAVTSNINWYKDSWRGTIETDARGYYAYLPAVFIYNDLEFEFYEELEGSESTPYYDKNFVTDYRQNTNNGTVNKYYCGTAIAEAPFFLIAHGYQLLTGGATDGYAKPYMIAISLAAVVYLFIGLIFLNKVLKHFRLTNRIRALVLILLTFGTNLFYYCCVEPGMSHIYSFALISIFCYLLIRFRDVPSIANATKIGVIYGLIVLIRPSNALILLSAPIFLGGIKEFGNLLVKPKLILPGALVALLVCSVQLIFYYQATGNLFVYSYGGESFEFTEPHIIDFLFSYKKGWFVYTPLALISILGTIVWLKHDRTIALYYLGFILLVIYVLSSWWNWWYGGSFSSRVMVDYLIFCAIPLGLLLTHVRKSRWVFLIYPACLACLVLCQIQTYQYRYFIIHWENMDKVQYWDAFLRFD